MYQSYHLYQNHPSTLVRLTHGVYSGEKGDSSIEQVSSVVDVPRFQLHVGILDPNLGGTGVHIQCTLEHRSSTIKLILSSFPLRILDPRYKPPRQRTYTPNDIGDLLTGDTVSRIPNSPFILGSRPSLKLSQFLNVRNPLFWGLELRLLSLLRFSKELLRGDLTKCISCCLLFRRATRQLT